MLRRITAIALAVPAAALLVFAALANQAWFERHVVVPAYRIPPPPLSLPALRVAAALLGLLLGFCAAAAWRRATPGGVVRVAAAILLSLVASEVLLRSFERPESEKADPRLEWILGVEDPRTGWAFVPNRTMVLPPRGRQRRAVYAIDAHGDRAPSQDWVEDPEAPTVILTGESTAVGHGLEWPDTIAARLAGRLRVQVVNVAEGGYGSDQAHLRAVDALARFKRPVAVVTLVLPVQLHRNIQDDRPRLVVRGGALVAEPANRSRLRLRRIFVDEIPYLSEARLRKSLEVTRSILRSTSAAARERGAFPLFVVPCVGPPREAADRPEAFFVEAVLAGLPHAEVDVPPSELIPFDGHPDRAGAERIAAAIASALAPSLAQPPFQKR